MHKNHATDFEVDMTVFDWMSLWMKPEDDEQSVRSVLGRLLSHKMILKNQSKYYLVVKKAECCLVN